MFPFDDVIIYQREKWEKWRQYGLYWIIVCIDDHLNFGIIFAISSDSDNCRIVGHMNIIVKRNVFKKGITYGALKSSGRP